MMATPRKPTKRKQPNKAQKTILDQVLIELDRKIDSTDAGVSRKITARQALVKSMVDEALKGDQRMLSNVLKLIERLEVTKEDTKPETPESLSASEWEGMFAFYGQFRPLIEQEIEKRKARDPKYWSFAWYTPTLKSAPWYKALYGKKS